MSLTSYRYFPPMDSGYSTEMKLESVRAFEYPNGSEWKKHFDSGRYKDPSLEQKHL